MELRTLSSLFLTCLVTVNCYPNGAPTSACSTMLPKHNGRQQRLPDGRTIVGYDKPEQLQKSPYSFSVNTTIYDNSGFGVLHVWFYSPDNTPVQGFMLQARRVGANTAIGNWKTISPNSKAIQCVGGNYDTVTHTAANNKTIDRLSPGYYQWQVPQGLEGKIVFVATAASNKGTFWTDITSFPIMSKAEQQKTTPFTPTRGFTNPSRFTTQTQPFSTTTLRYQGSTTQQATSNVTLDVSTAPNVTMTTGVPSTSVPSWVTTTPPRVSEKTSLPAHKRISGAANNVLGWSILPGVIMIWWTM